MIEEKDKLTIWDNEDNELCEITAITYYYHNKGEINYKEKIFYTHPLNNLLYKTITECLKEWTKIENIQIEMNNIKIELQYNWFNYLKITNKLAYKNNEGKYIKVEVVAINSNHCFKLSNGDFIKIRQLKPLYNGVESENGTTYIPTYAIYR